LQLSTIRPGRRTILVAAAAFLVSGVAAGVASANHLGPLPQCEDTHDNDSDGLTDWPDDPGCFDSSDNEEYNSPPPPPGGGGGGGGGGSSSSCDGSAGIYLYSDANYTGRCSRFTTDADFTALSGSYVGNDSVSSATIVGDYVASMYQHNYTGSYTLVGENTPSSSSWNVSNDQVSSLQVDPVGTNYSCEAPNVCPQAGADENAHDDWFTTGNFNTYVYSLKDSCPAAFDKQVDPITLVFYGNGKASVSLTHVQQHTGWPVKPKPGGYFHSWDSCGKTYGERASHIFFSARSHIRARRTKYWDSTWGYTTTATPHHEDLVWIINPPPFGAFWLHHGEIVSRSRQGRGRDSGRNREWVY